MLISVYPRDKASRINRCPRLPALSTVRPQSLRKVAQLSTSTPVGREVGKSHAYSSHLHLVRMGAHGHAGNLGGCLPVFFGSTRNEGWIMNSWSCKQLVWKRKTLKCRDFQPFLIEYMAAQSSEIPLKPKTLTPTFPVVEWLWVYQFRSHLTSVERLGLWWRQLHFWRGQCVELWGELYMENSCPFIPEGPWKSVRLPIPSLELWNQRAGPFLLQTGKALLREL